VPWRLEGTRGAFVTPEGEDPFTFENDEIAFDDGFTCVRAQ
jgi:hypothetical protein